MSLHSKVCIYFLRRSTILAATKPRSAAKVSISKDLAKMLNSEDFSDITFQFQDGRQLCAHKVVICCQSGYFSGMFQGRMKERQTSVLNITDTSYEQFSKLLEYF